MAVNAGDELKRMAQSLGIRPEDMAAAGNPMSASDSPKVYFGEMGNYTADGDVLRAKGGRDKYGGPQTKTMEEANSEFYKLSPSQLMEFQRRAVAAGIVNPGQIRLGEHDDESYAAWQKMNTRAARFFAVGKKVTPNEVLGMMERAYDPKNEAEDVAAQRAQLLASFGTQVHRYNRSDPAALRITAEAAFQQALGRKPKKNELEKFVNTFLGDERSNQARQFALEDSLEAQRRDRVLGAFDANAAAAGGKGGEPFATPEMEANMSESEVLWNRLQRMIADAPGRITPGKRSRSLEEQKRLYARYKAGKGPLAAKPGTSKHGDGRANDLTYENQATKRWALQNAHKYGLAFPLLNHGEDWHIEVLTGPGTGRGRANSASPQGTVAPISTSITNQETNSAARAAEFARKQNPVETAAYDIGGQFSNLLGILQKGVV